MKDIPLPVSRETGSLLYMLTRSTRAKSILEFGTSYGVSTIYLAAALRDNGGGRIITTEFESSKVARARQNLTEADLMDLVDIAKAMPCRRSRTIFLKHWISYFSTARRLFIRTFWIVLTSACIPDHLSSPTTLTAARTMSKASGPMHTNTSQCL